MSMLALILPCGFGFFTLMPTWSCLEHLGFLALTPNLSAGWKPDRLSIEHSALSLTKITSDPLHQKQHASLPSPSYSKPDFLDSGMKFAASVSPGQNMLGSLCSEGSGNLLNLSSGHSVLTEQLPQQTWASKYSPSQVDGIGNSMSHVQYSGRDTALAPPHCNSDAQNSVLFGVNIDSSGLLLPTTVPRYTSASADADTSTMPLGESGLQGSPYHCMQDSSELLQTAKSKPGYNRSNTQSLHSAAPEPLDQGDEKSDLLGYVVFSGKLVLDKRKISVNNYKSDAQQTSFDTTNQASVDAKLTSKALLWGSHVLHLDDVISVSYHAGLKYFTVHSYPMKKASCGLSCSIKSRRSCKDFRFVATTIEEAIQWVGGFADQHCFINCLPHPLVSSKKQASSELFQTDTPPELLFRCKTPPKMLVILNPRSGRGRSSKVFHDTVEPIFRLAGFRLEVVKTTSAGHARNLASTVDISICPDGIICVGGDGIINEGDNPYREENAMIIQTLRGLFLAPNFPTESILLLISILLYLHIS
ncbi:Sphingoid long-chain bases kinase 1 [Lathyrus oleraceus]|uniref:Sphingoid long-chain bases kinase 1 n=1 Tax=Pisum sativum TaxID=3888 RepID=A0A9D5AP49_PEA|nr:Sphingoid long-chain bases kinase 1 [Pisum sativum]